MPESNELTSSEVAVLESINGTSSAVSQREIARQTGLSVGLINAVIKRLVHTGYLKTSHLDRRSVEYLLTARGFAQTTQRSYAFVVDTVRRFKAIQDFIRGIIFRLHEEGVEELYVHGEGDLAELVEMFCTEQARIRIIKGLPPSKDTKANVVNASPTAIRNKAWKVIHVASELNTRL